MRVADQGPEADTGPGRMPPVSGSGTSLPPFFFFSFLFVLILILTVVNFPNLKGAGRTAGKEERSEG